jgi:ABC-type Na+ efflux pump permease subunit
MQPRPRPPGSLRRATLLMGRELRMRLGSFWFWAVASGTCLMAWVYGAGFLAAFETESVLVSTDPLMTLNALVVVFLGVVLGLRLAGAMAWEREHRTLEVLLVGPARWVEIIAAKFIVELAVLALLIAIYAAYLLVAQPLGRGVIATQDMGGLALLPAFALPTMALGLLVGAGLGTVRGAVLTFLILLGLLASVEVARAVLAAQPPESMSLTALYARHALDLAAPLLRLTSPAAQLVAPVEAMALQAPLTLALAAAALAQALAGLVAATLLGRLRGAL